MTINIDKHTLIVSTFLIVGIFLMLFWINHLANIITDSCEPNHYAKVQMI